MSITDTGAQNVSVDDMKAYGWFTLKRQNSDITNKIQSQ